MRLRSKQAPLPTLSREIFDRGLGLAVNDWEVLNDEAHW
jgi:hypothetical protein